MGVERFVVEMFLCCRAPVRAMEDWRENGAPQSRLSHEALQRADPGPTTKKT